MNLMQIVQKSFEDLKKTKRKKMSSYEKKIKDLEDMKQSLLKEAF